MPNFGNVSFRRTVRQKVLLLLKCSFRHVVICAKMILLWKIFALQSGDRVTIEEKYVVEHKKLWGKRLICDVLGIFAKNS